MNALMLKKYQEIAVRKGKTLLIESSWISKEKSFLPEAKDIATYNKIPMREGMHEKYRSPIAIVRDVEVTKFVVNLNGRIYPRELWQRIMDTKAGERTYCLADHPEDEGSVTKLVGVWHNFRVTDDRGIADLYLIGKHGQDFYDALQAGGRCGISTVGYGELEDDEKTVVWDTYELARLGDWVMDPSQQVYAEAENLAESQSDNEKGKTKTTESISNTNTNRIAKEVQNMSTNTALTLTVEARHLRNDAKKTFKEAISNPNLLEAKGHIEDMLEELPDTAEYADVRQKGLAALSEVSSKLKSSLALKEKTLKEQKTSIDRLQESYNIASGVIGELRTKLKTLNEEFTKKESQLTDATKLNEEFTTLRPKMEKELSDFGSKLQLSEKQVSILTKKVQLFTHNEKRMLEDIEAAKKNFSLMESDIVLFREQAKKFADLKEQVKKLVEHSNNLYSDAKCFVQDRKVLKENIRNLLIDRLTFIRDMKEGIKENRALKADNMYLKSMLEQRVQEDDEIDPMIDPETQEISSGAAPVPYEPPVEMETGAGEAPYDMSVLDPENELAMEGADDDTSFSADGGQAALDHNDLPMDPESDEGLEEEEEGELDPDIYGEAVGGDAALGGQTEMPYAGLDAEQSSEFDKYQQSGDGKAGVIKDPAVSRQMDASGAYKGLEVAEKAKKAIKDLYLKESKAMPSLRSVEKNILSSSSLKEAQDKIAIFKNAKMNNDRPFKMTERVNQGTTLREGAASTFAPSMKDDDWLKGRD